MNILALDTSSTVAGAAVVRDGKLVSEEYRDHRLTHSEIILPMAERVLAAAELDVSDMDAFAVNVGPGSFTGVRIGVCAVNAMAAALKKPVAAVDALEALAFHGAYYGDVVCPILDARGEQIYGAVFDLSGGTPKLLGERQATTIDEFLRSVTARRPYFVGDGAQAHRERIARLFPGAVFAPAQLMRARASSVAVLAQQKLAQGLSEKEALPLYLRRPQAERMRQNG